MINKQRGTDAPDWMKPAGLAAVAVGALGFVASAAVGGGRSLETALVAGALNPLFFAGVPLGIYWLNRCGFFSSNSPSASGKPPIQKALIPSVPLQSFNLLTSAPPGKTVPSNSEATSVGLTLGLVVLLVLVIVVMMLGIQHVDTPTPRQSPSSMRQSHDTGTSANETGPYQANRPVVDQPTLPEATSEPEPMRYWTYGSTRATVEEIQGTPRSIHTYEALGYLTWGYNSFDEVRFNVRTGRVIEWDNRSGSLRVALTVDGPQSDAVFVQGSTMADVLRAQGTPRSIHTYEALGYLTWGYNSFDEVRFNVHTGRVIEWDNRSGSLRVAGTSETEPRPPAGQRRGPRPGDRYGR